MKKSIAERSPGEWLGGGLMDPGFLLAVERSFQDEARFWNAVIRDDENRVVAAAFFSLYRVDPALFLEGDWKTHLERIRPLLPGGLRLPIVFCGTPVSTGESHLRLTPDAHRPTVLRLVEEAMSRIARQHGSYFLVMKEFDDSDPALFAALEAAQYLRVESWPMNHLPVRFHSFEELCAATRARYRSQIQRSLKKFARSGLTMEHVRNGAAVARLYTDEVHKLYLAVLARAEVKLEQLPASFFRELGRQLPHEIVLTTARQGDRVCGFVCSLHLGEQYFNLFCGVDYQLNEMADLYFNLLYQDADAALRSGAKEINVGQASYDFKSRMGCYTRPRTFFVKGRGWLLRELSRRARTAPLPAASRAADPELVSCLNLVSRRRVP